MRTRLPNRALTVVFLGVAATMGCADVPTGPDRVCPAETDLGTFVGTTSGAATDSFQGCAYFTVSPFEDRERFGMVLTNGVPATANGVPPTVTASIKLQYDGPSLAIGTTAAGTAPGEIFGAIFLAGDRDFTVTGGSVTIELRDSDILKGTLTLTGTNVAGATITVTGSFLANCVGEFPACETTPTR